MPADLVPLDPAFRDRVLELIDRCAARGIEMRPSEALRDPWSQARLWRQSRASEEIAAMVARMREAGAPFLADCLESVGPQAGPHVTDAPPGLSWHQWGEALDCFWVVDGRAEWSSRRLVGGVNGYRVYAQEAIALGLTSGGEFETLKDWPHVQWRADPSPLSVSTPPRIDAEMAARFGS